MGERKRIQSKYCKLRSQGNLREASEVFRRGEKEGWFRLRARSLRVMIASLECHLKEAGSSISIAKDREFVNSRKVLEGKARFLRERGHGRRPRASKALTTEDEELLWSKGILGSQSPRSLIATMWFVLTPAFRITRLLGAPRHVCRPAEDFSFSKDDNDVEFISYEENPSKSFPNRGAMFHRQNWLQMMVKLWLISLLKTFTLWNWDLQTFEYSFITVVWCLSDHMFKSHVVVKPINCAWLNKNMCVT